jgi:hypothetical protein
MPLFAGLIIAGGLGAAGSIGSSLIGSNAAQQASGQQVAMQQQALAQQESMFNTAFGAINPVISAGMGLLNQGQNIVSGVSPTLTSLLTPGTNMTQVLSQLPGFQFAQNWGQQAVQNLGTTTGLGGNVLTAGANYATGLAQQGYGTLVSSLQSLLNSGISLAGVGGGTAGSAASSLGGTSSNFGNTIGSTLTGIGQAQASGTLGSANALSAGLTGATSNTSNALLLSSLLNRSAANPATAAGALSGNSGITSSLPIPAFGGGGSWGLPQ